jgi:hypothetical protein
MSNANKGESKGKCTLLFVGDCQRYLGLRTNTNNGIPWASGWMRNTNNGENI